MFKYYDFFAESITAVLRIPSPSSLGLILPVGISFVTFEVLSYMIDVYRGEPEARTFLDLTLMVMFFPHLVAGPILKPAAELILFSSSTISTSMDEHRVALPGFLLGVVKKVVVADSLALFVDSVYARPSFYSSFTVWLAAIAYALQIYCDFSGYSDMAIASARCFGLEIPANFNMPYLSTSVSEFWRRWHISLSSWFPPDRLHPARRQPAWCSACKPEHDDRHASKWIVAWRSLALRDLGRYARARDGRAACLSVGVPRTEGRAPSAAGVTVFLVPTCVFLCLSWVFFRSPNVQTA